MNLGYILKKVRLTKSKRLGEVLLNTNLRELREERMQFGNNLSNIFPSLLSLQRIEHSFYRRKSDPNDLTKKEIKYINEREIH